MYLLFEILIARLFTALPYSRHFASPLQTGEPAQIGVLGGRKTKANLSTLFTITNSRYSYSSALRRTRP